VVAVATEQATIVEDATPEPDDSGPFHCPHCGKLGGYGPETGQSGLIGACRNDGCPIRTFRTGGGDD
jgi:hypothetical protein